MADSDHRKKPNPPRKRHFRRAWCCSFTNPPKSPENLTSFYQSKMKNKSGNSYPNSPQTNRNSLGLVGKMDPRRILSPGRVSPIDSDHHNKNTIFDRSVLLENLPAEAVVVVEDEIGSERVVTEENATEVEVMEDDDGDGEGCGEKFDVRLSVKGKDGRGLVLELDSKVLSENSSVFADLISEYYKNSDGLAKNLCRIEVPEVENLNAFHQTIELMYAEDITKRLVNLGVSGSIDTLEVAAGIMFTKGVLSCLKYLEAVPWSEDEEEKLKSLLARYTFDKRTTEDVLARLYSGEESTTSQQNLPLQLINSVTNCTNLGYSRKELKSLVKGLLSKSSVYEKDLSDLKKEDLYDVCQSCLNSLEEIFQEASDCTVPEEEGGSSGRVVSSTRPFIERISMEVDNINWLLDIMMEKQVAEEFVNVWAEQGELLKMHEVVSPMVRYEVSRISASVFIALGRGKLLCQSESRSSVFLAWFGPMLLDFGWLQRCRKGLDVKVLEESMGQALLMLPMEHQHMLFMEWFQSYSRCGAECPNLSKAFQVWWRRSFLKGSRSRTVELESSELW